MPILRGYLVGCIGDKGRWQESGSGGWLNFAEVIELLRRDAVIAVKGRPDIHGVEVIGIDFRERRSG